MSSAPDLPTHAAEMESRPCWLFLAAFRRTASHSVRHKSASGCGPTVAVERWQAGLFRKTNLLCFREIRRSVLKCPAVKSAEIISESWNDGVRGTQVLPLINTDAETMRVEAGPGTGKTFGLVRRVERIMHPEGLGVSGKDVLVVAFNRVIAKQLGTEINERLQTFDHEGSPRIRTIHALCLEVIGEILRLLLPHEREAMVYDVLEKYSSLR